MADISIHDTSTHSAPKAYLIQGAQEIVLKCVTASFDGTGAAGSFIPAVQVVDPSGTVVGTYIANSTLAAGASADVSWFPLRNQPCPPPAPSPNPLGTIWAWYDFSDTTTITLDGSGKITEIRDKTGNGHDASSSSAATRPSQTTVNALNAGLFASASSTALASVGWSPTLPSPYVIFVVWTQTLAGAGPYQPGPFGGSAVPDPPVLFENSTNTFLTCEQGVPTLVLPFGAPFTQQQATCTYHGGTSGFRLNRTEVDGGLESVPMTNIALGTAHLPALGGITSGMDGALCELLVYVGPLTATQLLATEAYLQAKWNTP